ncbi:DUF4334 domain-containing protein [Arthrobacter sp. ATA002]|uniref:DUF4334 domain-containing protein n=1 Tax=Arthrobacter sp. ATA002 TaxID=2991715 RepID=UPI0022A6E5B4|nr:DUF4334 domain-containing protein [Arthrobacter sp. ATA002]WAP50529.1 DUF4334 domain-containing protein [Arthrobacter sp. ATA002]
MTPWHPEQQTPTERLDVLSRGATSAEALAFFDALPPVPISEMIGNWHGAELLTGHPLDGVLGPLGWRGKRFVEPDEAHPLVFQTKDGKSFELNPGFVPLGLALRAGPMLRRIPTAARAARPLLRLAGTTRPRARLRMKEYRGVVSAAMIYDALPLNDAFRKVDTNTLLGAMDMRGPGAPFVFSLRRTNHSP